MALSLVLDNPYRVLGLGVQAQAKALSANYKRMMEESLKGNEVVLEQDITSYLKAPLRTPRRLEQAKSKLMSARGRMYHAMFWFVVTDKADKAALYYLSRKEREKAVKILQSRQNFSSYINLAVLALMEDRFDDAATLYSRCLQDEEMTQAFVQVVIGDKFKVKGAFLLAKVLDVLNQEKEKLENEDNLDSRAFVGAGHGVLNKEAQQSRTKLQNTDTGLTRSTIINNLSLKKQAGSFDRHLNEALNDLIDRIAAINREYGMDDDFTEVELNPNPAANFIIDEISRFLAVNNSLMEAFRQRCYEARERALYLDYVYNLASITHYAFHLYATEFGRMYSSELVQKLRSIIAKIERLYFRMKSDDIDYFINSLRRIEDALPYYYQIAQNFEKYYLLSDDKQLIDNFYAFNRSVYKVIDAFNRTLGLKGAYVDCSLHLQDMAVRYNVSFMLVLVNIALRHPYRIKVKPAVEQEFKIDESKFGSFGQSFGKVEDTAPAPEQTNQNPPLVQMQADGVQKSVKVKLSREEKKRQAEERRKIIAVQKRRSSFFKRKLARQRNRFKEILNSFKYYNTSPSTQTLVEITLRQVDRLPPPVSFKTLVAGVALIILAAAAVYINALMH